MIYAQPASPDIVITGARGMLGRRLVDTLGGRAVALSFADLDIRDPAAVRETVQRLSPRVLVNAAAYTDVDGCETNPEQAMAVNAEGARHLAVACREFDARLVHVSTDFVFDGTSRRPYGPRELVNPLSVYGRSKLEGEKAIQASGCRYLIVRTSWLFGADGENFVDTILRMARQGGPLRVVADQVGRPTYAADLAQAIVRLIEAEAKGIVHFANAGHCSWYEFAETILHTAGCQVAVEPIRSSELDRPAPRPAYSVLDVSDYVRITGHSPRPWQSALEDYFAARAVVVQPVTKP